MNILDLRAESAGCGQCYLLHVYDATAPFMLFPYIAA